MPNSQLLARVHQYLTRYDNPVKLTSFLGQGTDGAVWATNRRTAVKALEHHLGYANERDTYLRLAEYGNWKAVQRLISALESFQI
jgi:hypothetical protein